MGIGLVHYLEICYDFNRDDSCWCPRASVVFNVLLSARITSTFVSNISDCDEVFNYWEPVSTCLFWLDFVFVFLVSSLSRPLSKLYH